ncbi:MAG TPA: adenylate/guanylate cyclase domain-containing protein [Candidatus Kapabacteria bacterium]|nr:adenylate/guanylate cyclase domain-containing protein [Candidatus Kapabacteria bacterium]
MTLEQFTTKVEELEVLIQSDRDYKQSEVNAKELLAILSIMEESHSLSEIETRILIALAQSYRMRGVSQEVLPIAEKALAIAERIGNKELQAQAYSSVGMAYSTIADNTKAIESFHKAHEIFLAVNNRKQVAMLLYNIAVSYFQKAEYYSSLENFQKALFIAEQLNEPIIVALQLSKIGLVYSYLADYQMAVIQYQEAISIYQQHNYQIGLLSCYGNIGNLYREIRDYSRAIDYLNQALLIAQELEDKRNIAVTFGNLGISYNDSGDYVNAEKYFTNAIILEEELGNKVGLASNYLNLGNCLERQKQYEQALEYYQKSLLIAEQINQQHFISIIKGNIGSIFTNQSFEGFSPQKGEKLIMESININNVLGTRANNIVMLLCLAELYEYQKRWEEFAIYYKQYHVLEKEVQSEQAVKQAQLMEQQRKIHEAERDRQVKLARFQEQEKIFHNIVPVSIADRLLNGEKTMADSFDNVSMFFSDIVGFTHLASQISAKELVEGLNAIFTEFDHIATKHSLEKIKTIGDSYMAACGVPEQRDDHAMRTVQFALDIQEMMKNKTIGEKKNRISIRIGLHCGSAIAGIIGEKKFAYDLWGDAVNTAARMESHGEAGKIHVSEEFVRELLMMNGELSTEEKFSVAIPLSLTINHSLLTIIPRGEMEIKGKGMMKTYFLESVSAP